MALEMGSLQNRKCLTEEEKISRDIIGAQKVNNGNEHILYKKHFKRCIDALMALILIILFLPLFLFLALLVRINLGAPVLFKQERPGMNEKPFIMFKFRTMTDMKTETGELMPDMVRMTRFGKLLRKTSIDELPEIFNILKGDMSFIGPRPLLMRYLPYYRSDERARHSVRPGMTGLAQVSGRNFLNWDERFRNDVEYVDNMSFRMDISIALRTCLLIFKRSGIIEYDNVSQCSFKDLDEDRKANVNETT